MPKAKIILRGRKSPNDNIHPDAFYFRKLAQFENTDDAEKSLKAMASGFPANVRLEVAESDSEKNWVETAREPGIQEYQAELSTASAAVAED